MFRLISILCSKILGYCSKAALRPDFWGLFFFGWLTFLFLVFVLFFVSRKGKAVIALGVNSPLLFPLHEQSDFLFFHSVKKLVGFFTQAVMFDEVRHFFCTACECTCMVIRSWAIVSTLLHACFTCKVLLPQQENTDQQQTRSKDE